MKINRRWCLDLHALCSSCLRETNKQTNKTWLADVRSKRRIPCSFLFFFLVFLFSPPRHSFILKKNHTSCMQSKLKRVYRGWKWTNVPTITEIYHTRISWGPSPYSSTEKKKLAFGIHKHKRIHKDTNKHKTRITSCS